MQNPNKKFKLIVSLLILILTVGFLNLSAAEPTTATKIITPESGEYVIGTWVWRSWGESDFNQKEDISSYNHLSLGMCTDLNTLSTGYMFASKPWDKTGDLSTLKKDYPTPIYGYTLGGEGTSGQPDSTITTESFDIGTPWQAFDIDAEGDSYVNTKNMVSVYANVAAAAEKPILTTYTFEIDDNTHWDNISIQDRVTYLESLPNPPDRYILMCYWGTQWDLVNPTWGNGGLNYPLIESAWLPSLLEIPNMNPKKIYLAMCTAPAPENKQSKQFSDFVTLIKNNNLGGLYIWRSSGNPLTQDSVDAINELNLSTPLPKRK